MMCRTDADGYVTMDLQAIINHRKDNTACDLKDKHVCVNNQRKLRKSTQGWDLEVVWQDGSAYWIPLKDLKRSNPVEVTEYEKARNIDKEVEFHWWVPYVLKKREVIVSQATSRTRNMEKKSQQAQSMLLK